MSSIKIDARHIIAGRGLLRMTQEDLAAAAGITSRAIVMIENNKVSPHESTLTKIREALERRGIEFTNGDSPGVRLRPDKAIIPLH